MPLISPSQARARSSRSFWCFMLLFQTRAVSSTRGP
ncbi:hypothetical protein CPAR01_12450 [Colletotrichum paranaense]|uniref:Uncharacterized protein n=1 Tax=Colletotrichum paranaense TaxID=1914294 RepID=A0ABQ9S758_9PEZI|nr:uncharacterized protein CPAR01_12450 [Colletotrichum paranaense]KAK1527892.1 hypothetical protein CPAR01_12450 [Colletotrichum paranaense]